MRCKREIVGKNFEKRKNQVRETIKKKRGKILLEEIMGEKKLWEENLGKQLFE